MKNYKKHIDDFFREKLGRYTETPPPDVWDSLDVRLDTLKPVIPGSTPYKWLWHVGMVSLIVVLSVSLTHKFTSEKTADATRSNDQIAQVAPATLNTLDATTSTTDAKAVNVDAVPVAADNAQANTAPGNAQPVNGQASATDNNAPGNKTGAKQVSVSAQHVSTLKHAGAKTYAATGTNNSFAAKAQPADIYNSSTTANNAVEIAPVEKSLTTVDQAAAANNITPAASNAAAQNIPGTFKKDIPANNKKIAAKPANDKKHTLPADFKRWEAGVKGGYERGFDNAASTKIVVSPYIQYNISPKLSIMSQPGVKFANAPVRAIGTDQTYYQLADDGTTVQKGTTVKTPLHTEGGTTIYDYHTSYTFTQIHDSIVKSNTFGGSYMEYELPVLLKYKLTKSSSVYGGVNIVFSQAKGVTEHTYTQKGIVTKIDSTFVTFEPPTATPSINEVITHNGTPYSNYNGPLYPTAQENKIRFGAMLGFSYEYSRRWLFDALIQQNPAKADVRGGYNINTPLSSTYFRLSVGYKLTK